MISGFFIYFFFMLLSRNDNTRGIGICTCICNDAFTQYTIVDERVVLRSDVNGRRLKVSDNKSAVINITSKQQQYSVPLAAEIAPGGDLRTYLFFYGKRAVCAEVLAVTAWWRVGSFGAHNGTQRSENVISFIAHSHFPNDIRLGRRTTAASVTTAYCKLY